MDFQPAEETKAERVRKMIFNSFLASFFGIMGASIGFILVILFLFLITELIRSK